MGLTIHWTLGSDVDTPAEARALITQLRQSALDLPFAEVGELIELSGAECSYENLDKDDPRRWLLVQAGQFAERTTRDGTYHYAVAPTHLLAFETQPGEGSEPANFGLCRYPSRQDVEDDMGRKRRLLTGMAGWSWSSFCKTQFASNPSCGGLENFLRCHLSVVRLLDQARELGILQHVSDEGGFWEKRDVAALAQEIGQWNQMLAGVVGRLKDSFGGEFIAPITEYPNFEHLEAKGRQDE